MPRQTVRVPLQGPSPVFQIVSHGRKGRHAPLHLSPADIETIARTVGGTPEVVVKVSGGGRTAPAAKAHLDYIGRHGKLEIETDEGQRLQGRQAGAWLTDDWNLALSKGQYRDVRPGEPDRRPKVVHNLVFSMTKGTPPDKLLAATRVFAREQFALRHRYAMVLHTDQDHPHVHVVVKAESEQGKRLYIRKATLRQWREAFAASLRAQGVAANATPGAARGKVRDHKKDAIHQRIREIQSYQVLPERERRTRRPPVACRYLNAKVEAVAKALKAGQPIDEAATQRLTRTRHAMAADWTAMAHQLASQGETALAGQVREMVAALPPPITQNQQIARELRQPAPAARPAHPRAPQARPPKPGKTR